MNLQQLRAFWYKKLALSGFRDAELPSGDLRVPSATQVQGWSAAKAEYYRLAEQHLGQLRREGAPRFVRDVWELHSLGVGQRRIVQKLRCGRERVRDVVYAERTRMLGYDPAKPLPRHVPRCGEE